MIEIFDKELLTFENEDIKEFAQRCLDSAPAYWFKVAASSTGKYHPQYALGDGGLVRHTKALIRILNHIFNVESISSQFTSRERDLLRVAGLAHDMMKSGTQEDYERSKWTKFDHPLLAAKMVRSLGGLPENELELVAHTIESHMGQWCTDKRNPEVILPKPQDKYQILLHLCDYLASRKDIEIQFSDGEKSAKENDLDPATYVVDFGKYKGTTVKELHEQHQDYIEWLQEQGDFNREPYRTMFVKYGYKF